MFVDNVYDHDGTQNARIFSETIYTNQASCLRFYYTMTGKSAGGKLKKILILISVINLNV